MQFFKRFKIQTRIVFLVLIPLIVTFILSFERLNNAFEQQDKIKKLDTVLDYANVTYPYISGLLQEAFYARLYIDSKEDQQAKTAQLLNSLQQSREIALKRERTYLQFIDKHKDTLSQFQTLNNHLKTLRNMIKRMELIRKGADAKNHVHKTEKGDIHTMWETMVTVRRLVLTISEIVVIAGQNEQLGKMSNAYYNLVVANTETSFHNSYVYRAITLNIDVYIFGEIYRGATAAQARLELFQTFASAKARDALNKMRANDDYKTYEKVALAARSNIYQNVNKRVEVDPSIDWNKTNNQVAALYEQTMQVVLDELINTKDQLVSNAQSQVNQTLILMVGLLIAIGVISYFIARSITSPLKSMVASFTTIAKHKDMTVDVDESGSDELAELSHAFNVLLHSLKGTLSNVQSEADIINEKTNSVANAMAESTALSNNQLQATDSISVAINEMTATIEEVSNMASSTSDIVQKAFDVSVDSSKKAEISQNMMRNLTQELGATNQVVNQLNEESNQIGNVLNVIQGIAEQTNLLALNAAIEAARAGEMGRGFAVVADEVRSLAGRTQESTEQIRQQIETLQKGANAATANMTSLQEEGNKAVENVIESSKAFSVMKTELDTITQMALQIATAAEEQTSVSNEINERIVAIRDDTDNITHKTQDTAQAAQGLKQTGERLNQYIGEFKLR
ncbi:hypothetical protein C2869_00830 [Saccharobesus litoralis]|uniref:Methyl-accepting chemotaxis protein n=1 Tax=Saccharobesus litoralis TaxID=2172099 RepID=A0A2S0VLJ0_9ALTE|nr:methyl-accepting chemotaxis protein [Saccharobesus litoralis]AWB65073.1 hypothetical protein C2869_00830 [Saccharobesus litoralis]